MILDHYKYPFQLEIEILINRQVALEKSIYRSINRKNMPSDLEYSLRLILGNSLRKDYSSKENRIPEFRSIIEKYLKELQN